MQVLQRDLVNADKGSPSEFDRAPPRKFRIEKFKTLNDLKELIEQEIGIPRANQAFFVRMTSHCRTRAPDILLIGWQWGARAVYHAVDRISL